MKLFPLKLRVDYVDLSLITARNREKIDRLKTRFGHHLAAGEGVVETTDDRGRPSVLVPSTKYVQDLFYIAPFYHTEFPERLEKLIVLDVDLEVRIDIGRLATYFDKFASDEVIVSRRGTLSVKEPLFCTQAPAPGYRI